MPERRAVKISEAAALVDKDPRQIRRWIATGKLPAHTRMITELVVYADDVLKLASKSRRGRPPKRD